jgi:hypothetical protein
MDDVSACSVRYTGSECLHDMYKRHICSHTGSESLHDMYNSRCWKMLFCCLDVSSKKVHFFS